MCRPDGIQRVKRRLEDVSDAGEIWTLRTEAQHAKKVCLGKQGCASLEAKACGHPNPEAASTPHAGHDGKKELSGLSDTMEHWRGQEVKHAPRTASLWDVQREVNPEMRQILVEWLYRICNAMRLMGETFFLAVSCIDRYLAHVSVHRAELQLLGITCLWIAVKYEEVHKFRATTFAEATGSTYKISQLCEMERKVLSVLEFEVGTPSSLKFLGCCFKAPKCRGNLIHGNDIDVPRPKRHYPPPQSGVKSLAVNLLAVHLAELATLVSVDACQVVMPTTPAQVSRGCQNVPSACAALCVTRSPPLTSSHLDSCATASTHLTELPEDRSSSHQPPAVAVKPTSSPHTPPSPATPCASRETASPFQRKAMGATAERSTCRASNAVPSCLATARPSHIAAAALFASVASHSEMTPAVFTALLGVAQCEPCHLMQLAEALFELHTTLASDPVGCAMVERYRTYKAKLQDLTRLA